MKSQLVPIETLNLDDRKEMYGLLASHFVGVTWEGFQTDLNRKNWVLRFREELTSNLKGFSTLFWHQTIAAGQPISVVYSGDTIVDPSAWSSAALPRDWIAAINYLRQLHPQQPLYWLLICSGFRTYRFLPIFWKQFYPRPDAVTPGATAELINHLATEYYGDSYRATEGIVRFAQPQILRQGLVEIPAGRQSNPHVEFFTRQNPGYDQGDELVCLTEIRYDNLTPAGQRMWQAESSLEALQTPVGV